MPRYDRMPSHCDRRLEPSLFLFDGIRKARNAHRKYGVIKQTLVALRLVNRGLLDILDLRQRVQ